jgi:predicted CopG family antitoxin
MNTIPDTDTLVEQARRNHEDIIKLLESDKRETEFLEIGRLLTECKNQQYFKALNYPTFKKYVQNELKPRDVSYSYATRYIGVYELLDMPGGPPNRSTLQDIGMTKAFLLLPKAKRGEVTQLQWKMAIKASFGDLLREFQRDERLAVPILARARESPEHRDIQKKIQEIGKSLGKYAQIEYKEYLDYPSKEYKYDVVWKAFERALGITHVFEVCLKGGDLEHDIIKLGYAYKTMGQPRLFLVVAKVEDDSEARLVLSRVSSGDVTQNLEVLMVEKINKLYKELSLPTIRDFINLFMK